MDSLPTPPDLSAPLDRHRGRVLPEWIDYNGHMNVAFYLYAFDQATETFSREMGCDAAYVRGKRGMVFTLETHLTYDRELKLGDPFRIATQILDWDAKRVHFFHSMYHADAGFLASTNDQIMLNVGFESRRSEAWPDDIRARLEAMATVHGKLPWPEKAGRRVTLKRQSAA
jgi:acyl-CoA thioester hydrolase